MATGLRANFRAGLLAATLYFDGGCGDGEMRAARRQLEAYLQQGPQVTTFDSKPMHVALSRKSQKESGRGFRLGVTPLQWPWLVQDPTS